MAKVNVKLDSESPESTEIIADAIIKIADSFNKLQNTKLTNHALLLLIQDNCSPVGGKFNKKKPTIKQIQEILDSISSLKDVYIKKPVKK